MEVLPLETLVEVRKAQDFFTMLAQLQCRPDVIVIPRLHVYTHPEDSCLGRSNRLDIDLRMVLQGLIDVGPGGVTQIDHVDLSCLDCGDLRGHLRSHIDKLHGIQIGKTLLPVVIAPLYRTTFSLPIDLERVRTGPMGRLDEVSLKCPVIQNHRGVVEEMLRDSDFWPLKMEPHLILVGLLYTRRIKIDSHHAKKRRSHILVKPLVKAEYHIVGRKLIAVIELDSLLEIQCPRF